MRTMRGANWGLVLAAVFAIAGCDDNKGGAGAGPSASAKGGPSAKAKTETTAKTETSAKPDTSAKMAPSSTASGSTPAEIAANNAESEKAADELRSHHRHHHHGGVAMFIHMALDTLGLPADEKAKVDKIQADLHAATAPSREAARAVLQLLADGAAAGKIDDGKVQAALKTQEAASAKVHDAVSTAINALHDALKPEQRAALVEKVKAHVEVWKKVNHGEEHGSKDKGSRLAHLKDLLGLKDDQVDKISAALKKDAPPPADPAALDAHMKAFEAAFVADKFDNKTLATANAANSYVSHNGTARMVRFVEIVTPLLTPEQQKKFGEHLKERLNDQHATK